jgi:hypothetical protein
MDTYCQISHIGITGRERCYLLPVVLSFRDKCAYYAGLPIECSYNYYEGFNNIRKDKNVEHFEKLYKIDIQNLINICTLYNYHYNENPLETDISNSIGEEDYDNITDEGLHDLEYLRFMCVRKEVYDFFVQLNIRVSNDFDFYNLENSSLKLKFWYDYETNLELKEDFEKYYRFLGVCEHLNYKSNLYTNNNSFVQTVDKDLSSKVFAEFVKICNLNK